MPPTQQALISILIIDDEKINVLLLEETLSLSGYTTLSATNGADGRAIAQKKTPNLILLDISMPHEDGFEVLAKLKLNSKTSHIPVIFLTASSDVEKKIKGFDLGAVDYIVKPFHSREVVARINLHLKLSRATNAVIENQANKLQQIAEAQTNFLLQPKSLPSAKFSIFYKSLHEAGGDFYDVIQISSNITCYVVADISGHDIGSSFMTSALKALLQQNVSLIYTPLETMHLLNSIMYKIMPMGKFITACIAVLNRETGVMQVCNAAHPPLLHLPKNGEPQLVECNGDALGVFTDVSFEMKTISVSPEDYFFIYTDGLIERATRQKVWSSELWRLLDVAREFDPSISDETATKFKEQITEVNEEEDDDIVVIAVEV
jgi:sigma-B regulation protein RsbU (phosphoserine phosphatase)